MDDGGCGGLSIWGVSCQGCWVVGFDGEGDGTAMGLGDEGLGGRSL